MQFWAYWRFMQIKQKIFNCIYMQIMHFILDKTLKLLTYYMPFYHQSLQSYLISKTVRFFWPTLYLWPHVTLTLELWTLKSTISCQCPMDHLCNQTSKLVHLFLKYCVYKFGNSWMDKQTDGWMDRQPENIMQSGLTEAQKDKKYISQWKLECHWQLLHT